MTFIPEIVLSLMLAAAAAALFALVKNSSRLAAAVAAAEAEIEGLRRELGEKEARLAAAGAKEESLRQENQRLDGELKVATDRLQVLEKRHEEDQKRLTETFKSLSSDLLRDNSKAFLNLARSSLEAIQERSTQELDKKRMEIESTVKPLKDSLERMDRQIQELEKARSSAYSSITQQLRQVHEGQLRLRSETENLSRSLRRPSVRGRWGEIQLRRVVEMAGMVEYCDFIEQESTGDASRLASPVLSCSMKSQYSTMPAISTTRRSWISPQRPRTLGRLSERDRFSVSLRSRN